MFFQETIAACKTFANEKHDEVTDIFYAIALKSAKTQQQSCCFTSRHVEQWEFSSGLF